MKETTGSHALAARRRKHLMISVAIFTVAAVFIGILVVGLGLDQSKIPSAILETKANPFQATWIQGQQFVDSEAGETFNLDDFKGQPLILNFWASWCISCRTEAHELESFWRAYRDQGIKVVGIAIQDETESAKKFAQYYGKSYILGLDEDGKAAIDYGVSGVPETFLIDRDGVIRHKETGPVTAAMLMKMLPKIQ